MGLVKRTYVDGETVITADNLNDIQDEIIQNASDISTKGTYSKPSGGIPSTDLASAVQTSLGKADTALQSSDIDSTLTVTGKAADAKVTGDAVSELRNTLNHKADLIYDTASGDIASFPDGADGLPVKDLTVGIEPMQSGTGDPSPTNVRPISGWTGCNVTRTGKNLLDPSTRKTNAVRFYEENGFLLKAGQTYTLSVPTQYTLPNGLYIRKYGESGNFAYGYDVRKVSFTPESDVTAWFEAYYSSAPSEGQANIYLQLELGSTATDYELYSGTTLPISWQSEAGTVYGGELDVTSGVLTVYRFEYSFTGNESFATNSAWGPYAFLYNTETQIKSSYQTQSDCKSSHFNVLNGAGWNDLVPNYFMIAGSTYIGLGFDGTTAELKAWLASQASNNTPVQVMCLLTAPLVIQLDPVTMNTLLGQNNIWADCGPSTVEYPCDTKAYVDNEIGEVENTVNKLESGLAIINSGNTATQNIPAGSFVYIKNNTNGIVEGLYQNQGSIQISSGATLVVGTGDGYITAVSDTLSEINNKTILAGSANNIRASSANTVVEIGVTNKTPSQNFPSGVINITPTDLITYVDSGSGYVYKGAIPYNINAIKLNGTNGAGNSGIEIRNSNGTCALIMPATTPTSLTPSVWMEIDSLNKRLVFYTDTGTGWTQLGTVSII